MMLHPTSVCLPTGRLFATTGRLGDVAVHTVTPGSVAGMGDYSRWTVPAQALSPALHLRLSPAAPCYSAIPRHPTPPHATPRHPTPSRATQLGVGVGGVTAPFTILAESIRTKDRGVYLLMLAMFWTIGSIFS